jgi:hypothetical protein
MDLNEGFHEDDAPSPPQRPRQLPDDLPKSLNDRRTVPSFTGETEMYDAWQGKESTITGKVLTRLRTNTISS